MGLTSRVMLALAMLAASAQFCGLARTVNGFDLVRASDLGCRAALVVIARVERDDAARWNCSRAVHAGFELRCRFGTAVVDVLERSPVRPRRLGAAVRLANWTFRVSGGLLEGREGRLGWTRVARAPFCVPAAPREVLLALRLRPVTPNGGCFVRSSSRTTRDPPAR
jgi:hypothetical protein